MRFAHGSVLLLVSAVLVGLGASPVAAATGCDAPDTTWVGPATPEGSSSWDEPTNWTHGVPTAESVVCIPATLTGPLVRWQTPAVADVIDAGAATVTVEGQLTVGTSFDVEHLEGDDGQLHGPGATTVTGSLTGDGVTLVDAEVDLLDGVMLDSDVESSSGSLKVVGDVVMGSPTIDSLGGPPFTIAEGGSLTVDDAAARPAVVGGFVNHGEVIVTAGELMMLGAYDDAGPDAFSTGSFTAAPEGWLMVSGIELRTGARLDHVTWADYLTVPASHTVTVADSTLYWDPMEPAPHLTGAGELVATDNSFVGGRIGGALTVTVPEGEVMGMGDAVVQDQVQVKVNGELAQNGDIDLEGDAVLDVYGVHRGKPGGVVDFSGTDAGLEIIHPQGQLLSEPMGAVWIGTPFVNRGTVDAGDGLIGIGPRVGSPSSSSGTFRAGPLGEVHLGESFYEDAPPFALDDAVVEGVVKISGDVQTGALQVRGQVSTRPGGAYAPGRLELTGTTTLAAGASIAGNVTVGGQLQSDLGPTGTATLSGADVTGKVTAASGTLSIPSLAPSTLTADGTLARGTWSASPGATLNLPPVTTVDAEMFLGQGASFGDRMEDLAGIGPNGRLTLGGADLAVPGLFRNEGTLELSSGSRLDVGGKFRQLTTGTLMTWLDSTGRGTVRAAGPRDLAGELWIERDPAYEPPVGTVLNFITSDGAKTPDDAFDRVVSPKYGTRKIRVDYGVDKVRLWVDRVG